MKYRHYKTGEVYDLVTEATLVGSSPRGKLPHVIVVVYRSADGRVWCRPYDEFHALLPDGRRRFTFVQM